MKREYVKGTPTKKSAGYWMARCKKLTEENEILFKRIKEVEDDRKNTG